MTEHPMRLPKASAAVAAAFLLLVSGTSARAEFIENDAFPAIGFAMSLLLPDGTTESVSVTGSALQRVTFPVDEGSASDGDGDGLDEVPTELVALNLSGTSSSLGPISVGLNASMPSLGLIEERINNTASFLDLPPFTATGLADSFFDVFFELTIGGQILHNAVAAHMAGLISHKPASILEMSSLLGSFGPVELLDVSGVPTGLFISGAGGVAVPEPTTLAILGLGLAGLGLARRRRMI